MPRYYEDKPEGGACAGVKEDLGACLLQSDCVLQEGKSPRQCLKEGNCKALKYSFFECKRSMGVTLTLQFWTLHPTTPPLRSGCTVRLRSKDMQLTYGW
ncbi:cytochrome c oxidase assembly factor 5 isoform X1 [Camelus ferus]|uniref:Cytochrome c oxidase assembly factor 5 n=1 Tax=Camelus ferus TaxID=419612 RepID=A0A8B8S7M6_CAMFR|nr:cytochrome c oxidase assembly factor 5 isoform X1 [Camelus ferus]